MPRPAKRAADMAVCCAARLDDTLTYDASCALTGAASPPGGANNFANAAKEMAFPLLRQHYRYSRAYRHRCGRGTFL